MRLVQFTDADGKLIAAINPEYIISAVPANEGSVKITTPNGEYEVPQEQFDRVTLPKEDEMSRLNMNLSRLITALERLTVHIPTSIRMHL